MPNLEQVELAERVLAFIETNPSNWDQEIYLDTGRGLWDDAPEGAPPLLTVEQELNCGTSGCFAGWLAVFDGAQLARGPQIAVMRDGRPIEIDTWGIELLDLPPWEGPRYDDHLFTALNTMDDLRRHVADLRARYKASPVDA